MNFLQQLMLPQWLNGALESLLNYLLKRTAHSEIYLRKLNGKVLKINLQQIDFPIYFVFSPQRIDLLNQYEDEVDCTVSLKAQMLMKMPNKQQLSSYLNDQSILLQGDLQVLQDFTALLEFLEKDPAELLSPFVGDVVAQSAVNFLRNFGQMATTKLRQSQQYWGERLTEEWEVISPSLAIDDFNQQVKMLEKRTALLEQKLIQLETILN
ncbi:MULTISPECIES: ubiquinone biosynthesis accessory factor UbiJ [unclassified Avibacterium]|uniref:ubiquinone biosynthesis accessory factor UbiJ n=1 Tax=unclassified Avibacterium TaxID=2685287 RepID=UPI0020273736|nr:MULTISPECIES: SCP2 domain-containing protein [unclassified Avibacterium]MCW9698693.1 SCP2 domain-containing protein [Avibacterium sp. 20-129]MCW9719085.1 SCP2 domain-containing protein [Avibacterium sp. 21-599]MCW9732505.1 SCP2 domain-containing protein [Avibacterium sp. 20-15]URL04661.1 SCP2 domain-containing protein [Avibacterium sp. 20-132]URL07080.1 SCP2 domain-containing protein [Avibacterium sp. 21-595]